MEGKKRKNKSYYKKFFDLEKGNKETPPQPTLHKVQEMDACERLERRPWLRRSRQARISNARCTPLGFDPRRLDSKS